MSTNQTFQTAYKIFPKYMSDDTIRLGHYETVNALIDDLGPASDAVKRMAIAVWSWPGVYAIVQAVNGTTIDVIPGHEVERALGSAEAVFRDLRLKLAPVPAGGKAYDCLPNLTGSEGRIYDVRFETLMEDPGVPDDTWFEWSVPGTYMTYTAGEIRQCDLAQRAMIKVSEQRAQLDEIETMFHQFVANTED
jgi:hypothetical protein